MANKKNKDSNNDIILCVIAIIVIVSIFVAMLKLVVEYPWLLLLPLVAVGILVYIQLTKKKRKKEKRLLELERTSTIGGLFNEFGAKPQEFEKYIADLYNGQGFETYVTKGSNDGGKDIIMHKDGICYVVEVKLYATNNKIGRERIQKLHSAMLDEKASKAIFVTTSEFTAPAIEYAEKFGIELINSEKLVSLIKTNKENLKAKLEQKQ